MSAREVEPAIDETAFNCPHCGAYAHQVWYEGAARRLHAGASVPALYEPMNRFLVENDQKITDAVRATKLHMLDVCDAGGFAFQEPITALSIDFHARHLFISACPRCSKQALWVGSKLVFPPKRAGARPNDDLSADVRRDFEEARSIVDLSPRGAAALLRLCVQKLCRELGESGQNIDQDIKALVSKGLHPLIQKSLDTVRVIGNEAVHPGELDLTDDRATALRLFGLVNLIAEEMISKPKVVQAMFDSLPPKKLEGITQRDKAKGS